MRYVALLRGINVGGNGKVPMVELKQCFEGLGFTDVQTYINSGNVIFSATGSSASLCKQIETCLEQQFGWRIAVVVYDVGQYKAIVENAPTAWGTDDSWKHNALFLLPPYDMDDIVSAIGELKPDIEMLIPGDGVLYQSMSKELFGKTTTGKLASSPAYKRMTIRNFNTTMKLYELLGK